MPKSVMLSASVDKDEVTGSDAPEREGPTIGCTGFASLTGEPWRSAEDQIMMDIQLTPMLTGTAEAPLNAAIYG